MGYKQVLVRSVGRSLRVIRGRVLIVGLGEAVSMLRFRHILLASEREGRATLFLALNEGFGVRRNRLRVEERSTCVQRR